MKQYCRYCSHCILGDCFYCTVFDMELSESRIKRLNKCKEFNLCELGDVESADSTSREHQESRMLNCRRLHLKN